MLTDRALQTIISHLARGLTEVTGTNPILGFGEQAVLCNFDPPGVIQTATFFVDYMAPAPAWKNVDYMTDCFAEPLLKAIEGTYLPHLFSLEDSEDTKNRIVECQRLIEGLKKFLEKK